MAGTNYFSYFPTITYVAQDGSSKTVANILKRAKMTKLSSTVKANVFYKHTIRDEDRPELLADLYYGDTKYHWIILYANDIVNVYDQWPRSSHDFEKYIVDKYGSVEEANSWYKTYEADLFADTNILVLSNNQLIENEQVIVSSFTAGTGLSLKSYYVINVTTDTFQLSATNGGDAVDILIDGVANIKIQNNLHHYEDVDGDWITRKQWISEGALASGAISFYDYEYKLNEDKREINVIKKEYVGQIIEEMNKIFK